MKKQAPIEVRVVHEYSAPPDSVFDAWLDPALLRQWMFGPPMEAKDVIKLKLDGKVGGSFSFLVRREGHEIDHIGKYRKVHRPKELEFTWATRQDKDVSLVHIDIEPTSKGSRLTLTHELHPDWALFSGRAEHAWANMLEALDKTLRSNAELHQSSMGQREASRNGKKRKA